MTTNYDEPSDLELHLMDRHNVLGWAYIGPLTRAQAEAEKAYERSNEESIREHEAEMAAGGRTICPKCGQRTVKDRTVCTYGYPGHPGADYSALYECENDNCDYRDLAG